MYWSAAILTRCTGQQQIEQKNVLDSSIYRGRGRGVGTLGEEGVLGSAAVPE